MEEFELLEFLSHQQLYIILHTFKTKVVHNTFVCVY